MKLACRLGWHDWVYAAAREQAVQMFHRITGYALGDPSTEIWQLRTCKHCGKSEDRKID